MNKDILNVAEKLTDFIVAFHDLSIENKEIIKNAFEEYVFTDFYSNAMIFANDLEAIAKENI